ncbi:MAG TPA: hypothetical protein ENI52_05025, partial [Thermoplasmata archaeon]|nr:hypothetical protein [Thermoplasmata archaeon]
RQKAKQGAGLLGSPAPFGYEYNNGKLIGVDEELRIVKQIFRDYVEGKGMKEIAEFLNKEGIKTKRGGKWDRKTISRILSNPVYCGIIEWEEILFEGEHEKVVSIEEFNEVQKIKFKKAKKKGNVFIIERMEKKYIQKLN